MNEIYKPTIDDNKPEKEESWSPALGKYEEEIGKINKLKEQIAEIEKSIKSAELKEGSSVRIGLENNISERQRDIQEAKVRADRGRTKHNLSIRKLENYDPNRAGSA